MRTLTPHCVLNYNQMSVHCPAVAQNICNSKLRTKSLQGQGRESSLGKSCREISEDELVHDTFSSWSSTFKFVFDAMELSSAAHRALDEFGIVYRIAASKSFHY